MKQDEQIVYEDDFETADTFILWYKDHRFFHKRLAGLVARYLVSQIEDCFQNEHLPVLAKITHREKNIESLTRNLSSKRYKEATTSSRDKSRILRKKVGDLAGVRAVFYFADQVDSFCKNPLRPFETWFGAYSQTYLEQKGPARKPSRENSSHDYRSWHFPIRVQDGSHFFECLSNVDRKFLNGLFCEVQLRTILQDAWAEAEHDIHYKMQPSGVTKRGTQADKEFRRLAENLNEADNAFVGLKLDYKNNVELQGDPTPNGIKQEKHWQYKMPTYSRAWKCQGVEYDYELLHESEPGEGQGDAITIVPDATLFNVDQAMSRFTDGESYKHAIWKTLSAEEPQFISSITYDSIVVRATDWCAEEHKLKVQLAAYSDQVVTNHKKAHSKRIPGNSQMRVADFATLNSTTGDNGINELLPFRESLLANTLGVSCIINALDDSWLVGLRSPAVAFDPGTWGCSASGALNWIELGHWQTRDFSSWIKNGIIREVEEELGYSPAPAEVHYLGLAREFGRLGKPQILFLIKARIPCHKIISMFRTYKHPDSEYQKLIALETSQAIELIGKDAKRVQAVCVGAGISEELRFNLALALRYLKKINCNLS